MSRLRLKTSFKLISSPFAARKLSVSAGGIFALRGQAYWQISHPIKVFCMARTLSGCCAVSICSRIQRSVVNPFSDIAPVGHAFMQREQLPHSLCRVFNEGRTVSNSESVSGGISRTANVRRTIRVPNSGSAINELRHLMPMPSASSCILTGISVFST